MPAPIFARAGSAPTDHQYIQFGGLQTPIGNNMSAGNLAFVDLNDGVNWFAQGLRLPDAHHLEVAQYLWKARGGWLSEDYLDLLIKIPYRFEEGAGKTLTAQRATLFTAGEQYLTFDGATGYLVKCQSFSDGADGPEMVANGIPPLRWDGVLCFRCREPFFKDLATSSVLGQVVNNGANALTVAYPGSFYGEPVYQINIAGGNTSTITQLVVANTDSGETLTINCNLPSGAHTISIDTFAMTVTIDGTQSDIVGSFPYLYPIGTNHLTVTLTSVNVACSFDTTWTNRWV